MVLIIDVKVPPVVTETKLQKRRTHKTEAEEVIDRETWGNKTEFILSCIGYSVGLGNIWRFPYLAYKNGGGAFLVAYIVMLVVFGKPHFFAELAIGQFTGLSSIGIWKCLPIAKGVGVAMVTLSAVGAIYYNVVMNYTLYYLGQSFRSELPWNQCKAWWGANEECFVRGTRNTSCREPNERLSLRFSNEYIVNEDIYSNETANVTWKENAIAVASEQFNRTFNSCTNGIQTASEQFWEKYVLQMTSGIEDLGTVKWDLAVSLFICWMIVFLGIIKGIKSSGKVVYFSATFPYVILTILTIYGCTLTGAKTGLKYFFIPEWKKLLDIQIWRAAVEQVLISLGLGSGALIMCASYNKFETKLYRYVLLMSTIDFITSIMAGVVIFTVLGHMSTEMKLDISKVAKGGVGLAFVTYPEALAQLPVAKLWSALFFFMLFLLAIDTEIMLIENVLTTLFDHFSRLKKRKVFTSFISCICFFLLGLPCVMQGGQYILNLMDSYGAGYASLFIATFEITALMWGYGADKFATDLNFMLGFKPGRFWRWSWKFASPIALMFVLICSLSTHTPIKYGGKEYPLWADRVGWALVMVSVIQIPIWAVVQLIRYRKNEALLFFTEPFGHFHCTSRKWTSNAFSITI